MNDATTTETIDFAPCTCTPARCCSSPHPICRGGIRHPELKALAALPGALAYRRHSSRGLPWEEIVVVGGTQHVRDVVTEEGLAAHREQLAAR